MVLGGLGLEHRGGLHLAQPLRLGVSVNVLGHGLGGGRTMGMGRGRCACARACVCVCVCVCVCGRDIETCDIETCGQRHVVEVEKRDA